MNDIRDLKVGDIVKLLDNVDCELNARMYRMLDRTSKVFRITEEGVYLDGLCHEEYGHHYLWTNEMIDWEETSMLNREVMFLGGSNSDVALAYALTMQGRIGIGKLNKVINKHFPQAEELQVKIVEPPKLDLLYDTECDKIANYNYHDRFREFGISKREKFKKLR